MRSDKAWLENVRPQIIKKHFPPRIQKDLESITFDAIPRVDFDEGKGIFIYGPAGNGKTLLACDIILEEFKEYWMAGLNLKIRFQSVPEFFFEIKSSYDPDSDLKESDLLEDLCNTDLLVFDDIGVSGKISEWNLNLLYLIINRRYEHLRPTIFTSNLDPDQIANQFDERIASRIIRSGKIVHKSHWEDEEESEL